MSDIDELMSRIEAAFTTVKDKIKIEQQQFLKEHQERQKQLKEYEKVQARIIEVAKPRLEALAKRAGERVTVKPMVSQSRRSVSFEFRSPKAFITLTFSVAPDMDAQNAVLERDLKIVPVLWKFESHAEFSTPIANPNLDGVTKWVDDQIVEFVKLFIEIHEGEFYDMAEYVEDPTAKVKFPKFAAGATLEHGGQTFFFIDESTKAEFERQRNIAKA